MTIIYIGGVIGWDIMPKDVREQLDDAKGEDIIVDIASPGGFVYDGIEIFNMIRRHDGKVTTRLSGLAASMASYIAMAGDKVQAEDNAVFMIHNVWGLSIGDYRDFEKYAKEIEGLTNLLAKKYAEKSGRALEEIRGLMDDETYYFGDEVVEAGFVDEVIKTEKKKDKDSAVAAAQADVYACQGTMKAAKEKQDDISKAAALIGELPEGKNGKKQPQAGKENGNKKIDTDSTTCNNQNNSVEKPTTGDIKMTLQELLNSDAAAKAEYDQAINQAKADGKKEVAESNKAFNKKVSAYINGDYPEPIKALAVKVLNGESNMDALEAAVAAVDSMKEQGNSDEAAGETDKQPETPPDGGGDEPNITNVKTEADVKAAVDDLKKAQGRGEE